MTPTFSEGGSSSIGNGRGGGGAQLESYRPNNADALDVEVARIVNGHGIALERVDPPLPKGVRAPVGPGKDSQARYTVAGKTVACRLLELVGFSTFKGQLRPTNLFEC